MFTLGDTGRPHSEVTTEQRPLWQSGENRVRGQTGCAQILTVFLIVWPRAKLLD